MKISFIDDEPEIYPLQYGGKARAILTLAKSALSLDASNEVTILSRSINDSRDKYFDYDGILFEKMDDHNMISRIIEEAEEADVLSVHTCSFTFPRIPSERRKAALVYHLHDLMLTTADKGSHLDKALAGDWDAIVSPSDFATTTYHNFAALMGISAEIHTIPRGVDPDLFHEIPKEDAFRELRLQGVTIYERTKPILLFPGRVGVGKGEDRIRQICESLLEDYPECLIITTSDIGAPKQHPSVIHVGWQNSSNLKYLYSAADLTVSISNLPESFSQVCIESVACGTPVLAFPFGNLSRLSQSLPAIFTCEPTAKAICAGVYQLITDPKLGDKLSRSRATINACYSLLGIGNRYAQLYVDVVRRREPRVSIPEIYFLSPFAIVHNGKVYLSNNDGATLKAYDLSEDEKKILSCCASAKSIGEIALATSLGRKVVCSTLNELRKKKVIIGGRDGRRTR